MKERKGNFALFFCLNASPVHLFTPYRFPLTFLPLTLTSVPKRVQEEAGLVTLEHFPYLIPQLNLLI
jgi:hypothetical protein